MTEQFSDSTESDARAGRILIDDERDRVMKTSHNTRFRSRFGRGLAAVFGAAALLLTCWSGSAVAQPDNGGDADGAGQRPAWVMAEPCPEGYLCLWDQPNGQGNRIDLLACPPGVQPVDQFGLTGIRSYINNQTDGTVSTFWGPPIDGAPTDPWLMQYSSTAFEFNSDTAPYQTLGVDVC